MTKQDQELYSYLGKNHKIRNDIYSLVKKAQARGHDVEAIFRDLAERDPDPETGKEAIS